MTPARIRRAAEILRSDAEELRRSETVRGKWTDHNGLARDVHAFHDEAIELAAELDALAAPITAPLPVPRPTEEQMSATLQLFRSELDKNMDTRHGSASPGHDAMRVALRRLFDELARARIARRGKHDGEHCATDESAASVCDGMYGERTDEVLGLVEALDAIRALAGGHGEQAKAISKIIDDAIEEHAAWTQ